MTRNTAMDIPKKALENVNKYEEKDIWKKKLTIREYSLVYQGEHFDLLPSITSSYLFWTAHKSL